MNLSTFILTALAVGAVFGTVLNTTFPEAILPVDRYFLAPVGASFLRIIQFVVVPLIFSSLILGVNRIQGTGQVGRYVLKLMTCYVVTSLISLGIGMVVAIFLQPGVGMTGLEIPDSIQNSSAPDTIEWLLSLIPTNPLGALASGNLLQVIISAALFGTGIQMARSQAQPFVDLLESIYIISEKILAVILYTAPLGVFALISSTIATQGLGLVVRLSLYVLGLFIAASIMAVFYVIVLVILKADPAKLFRSLMPSFLLGFGTASSSAVLPTAIENLESGYGLRSDIVNFALPLGTALKRDGATILQGFNAIFIAQIYHIPLTPSLLFSIGLSSFLISFSTPGVPGSALITMTTVLSAAGLPLEGIAIVAGIDRLTDGVKTVLNIIANSTNAVILGRWEPLAEPVSVTHELPQLAVAPVREPEMHR